MAKDNGQPTALLVGDIWERLSQNRLLYIGLVGAVVLLAVQLLLPKAPLTVGNPEAAQVSSPAGMSQSVLQEVTAYRQALEEQLVATIGQIEGVGDVKVMLTLGSGPEVVPAFNTQSSLRTTEEKDANGGTRVVKEDTNSAQLVMGNADPITLTEKLPPVSGVVVVAQGADQASIQLAITRAVQTALGIPAYKIDVFPGK